jgi:hypothetical protein
LSRRFAGRKEKKTSAKEKKTPLAKEKKTSAIRKSKPRTRKTKTQPVPKGWAPFCWKDPADAPAVSDDDSQYGDSLLGEGEHTRPRKAPVSKKPADVRKAMW